MAVKGRLKNGDLLLAGEINERLPAVKSGLVAHFPFDGTGGAFDIIGGSQPSQNTQGRTNLVEALHADWKRPSSWQSNAGMSWDDDKQALKVVGYHNTWLKTPIIIDPTKTYQLMFEVMVEVRPSGGLLYLGGLSNNAIGQRATANYDYTIAAAAAPTLGEWTTFRLTRTGTAVAWSSTSYSYNTIKGWTGDTTNAAIPDRLIKNYYMGGLFNYSAGGTMYIRNMRMEVANADTSGALVFDENIAIEDAATNLWSGPLNVYNNYSVPASLTKLKETFRGEPVWRLGMTVDTANSANLSNFQTALYSHGVVGGPLSWVQDTQYVSSIYWRPVNKPDTVFGGTASNIGGWSSGETEKLSNGWNRYYRYRTGVGIATVSDSVYHSFYCPSLQLNETIYIDVCCPQTEQGRIFPTSYTPSTRASGRLDLPIPRLETYTVFGCFIPSSPFKSGTTVYNTAAGASLIRVEDSVKAGSFSYRYYLSGSASAPYVDQDGYYGASNIHKYYEIEAHKPVHFAIRKSGTQVKMKLHQNGWKDEHVFTVPADAGVDILKIGDTTRWNGKYNDISVYNRSLTDEEVNKLSKNVFSILQTGVLVTSEVVEKPNGIPSDAQYIPLGVNGMDEYQVVPAANDSNSVYEDGNVFLNNTGILNFNFYRDYGLDWSKDWSIVYWKKPIATNGGSLTGYNIESLGSNSNSVGGGYWWFGKPSGANYLKHSINPSISATFVPANYFEKWHMVSITKSGSTITYSHRSETLSTFSSTFTTTIAANYFVTQHGYDFMFGWDAGNACHTHYKDLMIAKRALSLTELEEMHKTQMRAKPDRLQIRGQFIEGATLA